MHAVSKLQEPARQPRAVRSGPLDADADACRRIAYLVGQGVVAFRVRGELERSDRSAHMVNKAEGVGVLVRVDASDDRALIKFAHMQPFRSTSVRCSEPKAG